MTKPNLLDAWSRFTSEVLNKMPEVAQDARRVIEWTRTPHRLASEMHDAWLDSVGGVSKNRYMVLLEENLELRRKLEALENNRNPKKPPAVPAAATNEAMDGAFKQMREAQEQWLSLWLPQSSEETKKY